MNERIKELAELAGLDPCVFYDNLLRISDFAELVRQDEREACLAIVETHPTVREMSIAIRARSKHD